MLTAAMLLMSITVPKVFTYPEDIIRINNPVQLMDMSRTTQNEGNDLPEGVSTQHENREYFRKIMSEDERIAFSPGIDPMREQLKNLKQPWIESKQFLSKHALLKNSLKMSSPIDYLPEFMDLPDLEVSPLKIYRETRETTIEKVETGRDPADVSYNIAEYNCHANNLRICGKLVIDGFKEIPDFLTKCGIKKKFLDCMVKERQRGCKKDSKNLLQILENYIADYRNEIKKRLSSANGCLLAYEL